MYGNSPTFVSRKIFLDPRGKSNFDAGVLFLYGLTKIYPNLTWGDLPRVSQLPDPQFMAGWWTDMKRAVSNTASTVGRWHSDATRLIANKKVSSALSSYIAAYYGGGLSSMFSKSGSDSSDSSGNGDSATAGGAGDFFKSLLGSLFTPEQQQQIEQTGKDYKQSVGIDWGSPVVLGVGGVAVLGLLYAVLHRRN